MWDPIYNKLALKVRLMVYEGLCFEGFESGACLVDMINNSEVFSSHSLLTYK